MEFGDHSPKGAYQHYALRDAKVTWVFFAERRGLSLTDTLLEEQEQPERTPSVRTAVESPLFFHVLLLLFSISAVLAQ